MIGKIEVTDGAESAIFLVGPDGVNLIKDGSENWYLGSVTWNMSTITWADATVTSGNPLP
jgi:hypothetical protein